MDQGARKYGLAALLVGGAVSAGEWPIAIGAFVVYVLANVYLARKGVREAEDF